MPLRFYNTLARKEEEFRPLDPAGRRVTLYCCGPTVYDFAHIGNFRAFLFEDLLRRHLEARGFKVFHVMNITDVEDKIIRSIHQSGESLPSFTGRFEKAFLEDMETLGCLRPAKLPRATEHVAGMIGLIRKLEAKGLVYRAEDGSVYFSVEKFPAYGQLARLDRNQLKPGARISQDEYQRESYGDFVLWKAHTERDGNVAWESPWGKGRPGWHIECSCMSMEYLGETFDIHCGGEDLIFPHHEDEIAQSEGATGKPFVRFWLHNAHLLVEGRKMSKSEGNFFTLRDLLAKGYSGREIRYALLSAHYRLPLNFTLNGLDGARRTLQRLDAWVERLRAVVSQDSGLSTQHSAPGSLATAFLDSLDADLNLSGGLGRLFDALNDSNRLMDENRLSVLAAADLLGDWRIIERVLGLPPALSASAPTGVEQLARERQTARTRKDWKRSDELRNAIKTRGWSVQDSVDGYKLMRL